MTAGEWQNLHQHSRPEPARVEEFIDLRGRFMNNLRALFAVGAMFTVSGLGDDWTEQYFKAKHGRSSPREEARQKSERANTAWREEPSAAEAEEPSESLAEQAFRAKHGRNSPKEETRQKTAQANTAWREEPLADVAPPPSTWAEQVFRAKYGRSSPREEARQKPLR